jgi:tRNA(His) 5'-end guanylyltransferase
MSVCFSPPPRLAPLTSSKGHEPLPVNDVPDLAALTLELHELLLTREARRIPEVPSELHELPPFIPKLFWTKLGEALKEAERPSLHSVPGSDFYTLRLDGSGFSKLTKRLRSSGVISAGYSPEFAEIMRESFRSVMVKFNALCSFTQSDEMTVVVGCTRVIRDEQQPHTNGGRVLKLCTHAASHVTALFNHRMEKLFAEKGLSFDESYLACFDCRLGRFATLEEAMTLVYWRAFDCGVNGPADAVHHCRGLREGASKILRLGTHKRLEWLASQGLLPLPSHQAHGSFFVKVRRAIDGFNPKTGQVVASVRGVIEELSGNVLCRAAAGTLFPEGDVPLAGATDVSEGGARSNDAP